MTSEPTGPRSPGPDDVADRLDRLFCYHMMMAQWTLAVGSRHSTSPHPLLADLHDEADAHLDAAKDLAGRVAQLGGIVTADPSDVVYRAPVDSFEQPDNRDDGILVQLHRLTTAAITTYRALLATMGESDPATSQIVEGLLASALDRQSELSSPSSDRSRRFGNRLPEDGEGSSI